MPLAFWRTGKQFWLGTKADSLWCAPMSENTSEFSRNCVSCQEFWTYTESRRSWRRKIEATISINSKLLAYSQKNLGLGHFCKNGYGPKMEESLPEAKTIAFAYETIFLVPKTIVLMTMTIVSTAAKTVSEASIAVFTEKWADFRLCRSSLPFRRSLWHRQHLEPRRPDRCSSRLRRFLH
jgi:hypothetical protein